MLDRSSVVDEQFLNRVQHADFPKPKSTMSPETAELDKKTEKSILKQAGLDL